MNIVFGQYIGIEGVELTFGYNGSFVSLGVL